MCTAVKKVVLSNLYWRNISVRFLNAQLMRSDYEDDVCGKKTSLLRVFVRV